MPKCGETAVLIITLTPEGTSTNVARRRIALRCDLESGHEGSHRDSERGEDWEPGKPVLLRHEDETR